MHLRNVTVLVTAAAFGLVFACTVKTESPDNGNTTRDGGSSSSSSGTSGNSSSSGGDAGASKGDPVECKKTADFDKCETCCGISEEVSAPYDATYVTCLCDDKCKTECGSTYCTENGGEPTEACIACLDREEPGCYTKAKTECDKDSKCKAFMACATEACSDKLPDEPDGG